MIQEDIHDDRDKRVSAERDVRPINRAAARNLKSSDKVEVMRLHHYRNVLACEAPQA